MLQALVDCKLSVPKSFPRRTFQAVRGVLLFGAPHRGMHVDDILEMATELSAETRMDLVNYLKQDSNQLQQDLNSFRVLAGDFPIVSFYETILSQALMKAEVGILGLIQI